MEANILAVGFGALDFTINFRSQFSDYSKYCADSSKIFLNINSPINIQGDLSTYPDNVKLADLRDEDGNFFTFTKRETRFWSINIANNTLYNNAYNLFFDKLIRYIKQIITPYTMVERLAVSSTVFIGKNIASDLYIKNNFFHNLKVDKFEPTQVTFKIVNESSIFPIFRFVTINGEEKPFGFSRRYNAIALREDVVSSIYYDSTIIIDNIYYFIQQSKYILSENELVNLLP